MFVWCTWLGLSLTSYSVITLSLCDTSSKTLCYPWSVKKADHLKSCLIQFRFLFYRSLMMLKGTLHMH